MLDIETEKSFKNSSAYIQSWLTEIIMTKVSSAEDEVIALEILKLVMENLTIRQQNIITLKMLGYSNTEICLMMEISKSSYYRELENIRQMLVDGKF